MNELELSIGRITDKIHVIPATRGYWVNRTEDGALYETFYKKKIIGLNLNEISLSKLAEIRKQFTLKNDRIGNYGKVQNEIINHYKKIYEKKIREAPKHKKQGIVGVTTKKANQVFNFVFKMKKGDYVAIPSSESQLITIGRISKSYIDNSEYTHLQRSVDWIDTFRKTDLDIRIFQVFSSHLALYDISKYKDVILRSLYDFYFEENEGHLVLNLGKTGKISFQEEAKLLYYFNQLFNDYLKSNDLPFSIDDISTIVNLNSKGKRKLFGKKHTTLLAALFITIAIEGDTIEHYATNKDVSNVTKSIQNYLINGDGSINGQDLKKAAEDMNVDKQEFFKRMLRDSDNELDSIRANRKKINSYY